LRVPLAPIRKGILKLCSNLGDHADSSDEASSKEVEEAVEGTLKGKQPQRNERAPDLVWGSEEWYESTKLHDNVHRMCTRNGSEPSRCIVRKVIKRSTLDDTNEIPREIQMLEKLPHHHRIVHHLGLITDDPELFAAIFPDFPKGDVGEWMRLRYPKDWVPELIIWRFFVHMTQALAFIHGDNAPGPGEMELVLHKDIKPQNIMITYDGREYPSFEHIDFGLAKAWPTEMPEEDTFEGTISWHPPETPKIKTKAADIWSIGACVYYLATRKRPVEDTHESRKRTRKEA
jgi:serine/threonine protein kinase